MLKLLVMMLVPCVVGAAEVQIFDSKVDNKISWILVDDCLVEVPKGKLKNTCFILKKVNKECNLKLNLDDCRD